MKHAKRIIAALLALGLCATLAACGEDEYGNNHGLSYRTVNTPQGEVPCIVLYVNGSCGRALTCDWDATK